MMKARRMIENSDSDDEIVMIENSDSDDGSEY